MKVHGRSAMGGNGAMRSGTGKNTTGSATESRPDAARSSEVGLGMTVGGLTGSYVGSVYSMMDTTRSTPCGPNGFYPAFGEPAPLMFKSWFFLAALPPYCCAACLVGWFTGTNGCPCGGPCALRSAMDLGCELPYGPPLLLERCMAERPRRLMPGPAPRGA